MRDKTNHDTSNHDNTNHDKIRGGERMRGRAGRAVLMALCLMGLGIGQMAGAPPMQAAPAAATAPRAPAVNPDPAAVIRAIYQHYLETAPDTVVGFDYTDPTVAKDYFDPQMAKLLVADAKSAEPRLNFDPFIEGQDFEIAGVSYETKAVSKTTASVIAQFDNFDEKKTVTFKLVRTPAGWRVADVQWDRNAQSLRTLLTKPAR